MSYFTPILYVHVCVCVGTHFSTRIVVGSKRITAIYARRSDVQLFKQQNIDVNTAFAFDTRMLNSSNIAAASLELQAQASLYNRVSSSIESREEVTVGGFPSINFYEWSDTTIRSSRNIPIQYSLKPIYTLITGIHMHTCMHLHTHKQWRTRHACDIIRVLPLCRADVGSCSNSNRTIYTGSEKQ